MDLINMFNIQRFIDIPIDTYQSIMRIIYPFIHPFTYTLQKAINQYVQEKRLDPLEIVIIYSTAIIIGLILYRTFQAIRHHFCGYHDDTIAGKAFRFMIKHVWITRKIFQSKLREVCDSYAKSLAKNTKDQCVVLPAQGVDAKVIKSRISQWYKRDQGISYNGKISGCRYTEDHDLDQLIRNQSQYFIYHNPLHTSEFPSARQMECELIAMTCNLFNNPGHGVITTGGTQSIALAVLAHRNYYREFHGISKPNMVMPNTAHVAFNKACHYFGVELRSIPVDPKTLTLSAKQISRHIDSNTVLLVGSYPNFCYGNVQNIPQYAQLAKKRGIGLHVDCCLGGFLAAFKNEVPSQVALPPFDFSVDGVTSMSCDHHQYALAPKGVSICMFSNQQLRHGAYFGYSKWPGGLYITPTMSGSRTAAPIAGAWISMMYNGRQKYVENARKIQNAIIELKKGIQENFQDQFEILGSDISVVSFRSKTNKISIYQLNDCLHKQKDWTLAALQKPPAIHVSMTLKIANNIPLLLKDLRECYQYCLNNPQKSRGSSVEFYGASVLIPDGGALEEVMKGIVDETIRMI